MFLVYFYSNISLVGYVDSSRYCGVVVFCDIVIIILIIIIIISFINASVSAANNLKLNRARIMDLVCVEIRRF